VNTTPPHAADLAVEAAIGLVLASERAARDAVAQATRDAERLADDARAGAREIAERTDRRIRGIRAAFEARAVQAIAAIDAEAALQDATHELSAEDFARLARAVDALCEELTGEPR
jgi:hypothetical protein